MQGLQKQTTVSLPLNHCSLLTVNYLPSKLQELLEGHSFGQSSSRDPAVFPLAYRAVEEHLERTVVSCYPSELYYGISPSRGSVSGLCTPLIDPLVYKMWIEHSLW